MPREDALVLNLLRFPQEIVAADEFSFPSGALTKYRITATELRMGEDLLKAMSGKWNAADYKDEFREKLRKLIQKHVDKEQGTVTFAESGDKLPEHAATNVVDFMALLKKSLAANEKSPARARQGAREEKARPQARLRICKPDSVSAVRRAGVCAGSAR
jgi:DNA end-binding protein Ku